METKRNRRRYGNTTPRETPHKGAKGNAKAAEDAGRASRGSGEALAVRVETTKWAEVVSAGSESRGSEKRKKRGPSK